MNKIKTNFLFQYLSEKEQNILTELADAKNKTYQFSQNYDNIDDYLPALTIFDNKHTLKIAVQAQNRYWELDNKQLYPFQALKVKQEKHVETRYDDFLKIVVNQIGDFDEFHRQNELSVNDRNNEILSLSYEFYLDDKLIAIRNYNADLLYFLKTNAEITTETIYRFVNDEISAFNKENYKILALFGAADYFRDLSAHFWFNRAFEINIYLKSFLSDKDKEIWLSAIYFQNFAFVKLQQLLAHNFAKLKQDGFDYELRFFVRKYEEYVENAEHLAINVDKKRFTCEIIEKKSEKTLLAREFDFNFYGLWKETKNGKTFAETKAEIDTQVIKIANEFNKYLQHNVIINYHKILKQINWTYHNVDFKHLVEGTIYAGGIQFDYGHLKLRSRFDNYETLDNSVLFWKIQADGTLFFNAFKIGQLAISLDKYKTFTDLPLKYTIKNANAFKLWVYAITVPFDKYSVDISIRIPVAKETALWENNDFMLAPNVNDYTKCGEYASVIKVRDKLWFTFSIPFNENLNEILHGIYDEFKDKIILKENVKKKLLK